MARVRERHRRADGRDRGVRGRRKLRRSRIRDAGRRGGLICDRESCKRLHPVEGCVTVAARSAVTRETDKGGGMSKQVGRIGVLALAAAAVAAVVVGASSGAQRSKGQIIIFGPTSSNNYVAQLYKGAKQTAARQGYDLKIVENNF